MEPAEPTDSDPPDRPQDALDPLVWAAGVMEAVGYDGLQRVRGTQLDALAEREEDVRAAIEAANRLGDIADAAEGLLDGPLAGERGVAIGVGPDEELRYGDDPRYTYLGGHGSDDDGFSLVSVWRDERDASLGEHAGTLAGAFLAKLATYASWEEAHGPEAGDSRDEIVGLVRRLVALERSRAARLSAEAMRFGALATALDQKRLDPSATPRTADDAEGEAPEDDRVLRMGLALIKAMDSDEAPSFLRVAKPTSKGYLEWCGDQVGLQETQARALLQGAGLLVPGTSGKSGAAVKARVVALLGHVREQREELGERIELIERRVLDLLG